MTKKIRQKLFQMVEIVMVVMVFSVFFFVTKVSAVGEQYPVDEQVVIGEFVYDDAYVATTTDCFLDIWAPYKDGNNELVPVVSNALMSTSTTGWHYYNFTGSSTPGIWPANMECGSVGVDLIKGDKTFVLTTTTVVQDVASAVWNTPTSTFNTIGSVGKHLVDTLDAAVSSIVSGGSLTAADVWSYSGRTLTSFGTLISDIWSNGTRTMTAFGNLAADVWNDTFAPTRALTTKSLGAGGNLATETYLDTATSTIVTEILNNQTLINNLNDISAADVWSYGTRNVSLTDPTEVWSVATSTLVAINNSVGKQLVENLDAKVSSSGSSLTAADVWAAGTRTLTDYSENNISAAVWANAGRTLTDYGNDITAADVWNVLSSTLTSDGTIGKQVASVSTSTIALAVWDSPSRTLTSFGTLVSDIWSNGSRTITSLGSVAADVWNDTFAPTRSLTDYATSTIAAGVWSNATRTLTYYGNDITAADVWAYIGSVVHSGGNGSWTVNMTDTQQILAGNQYRVKIYTSNAGQPADSFAAPQITIYDVNRNTIVSNISMTDIGTGIYEYVYSVPTLAAQGVWETIVTTEVTSGQVVTLSDYWEVRGAPAQVIINSITDNTVPSIAANVTISNEGTGGYEYLYEWCVVTSANNTCGGGDDVFYASAAKFIQANENWNTTLTADVANTGNYYFKLVVYFGTESSGSSRSFTAISNSTPPTPPGGGGGGGGGNNNPPTPVTPPATTTPIVPGICSGADLNHDNKVNSVDFSILLYFWKTRPPYLNACVDMNDDDKVDSVDFSILLYQWGSKGIPIIRK